MSKNPMISIRNLYKIFGDTPDKMMELVRAGIGKEELLEAHGHVLGLQDINVDMQEGETTVVMGLSGSGKSTLIRHINRLIDPTAGEVLIQGDNVLEYDSDRLRAMRRSQMSMVFQHFALLPHRNVLENVALAPIVRGDPSESYDPEARHWLERVGLAGYEDHYPHQLSGGMQQRVGIARALTSNAPIMLMDEAFSALDPLIRTDMQDLLLELQNELAKTIVFISHDLDEALKLADHLVILKDGLVVQQDEPQHILLNPQDDYVVDFIADINRARVLRVRSIMDPISQDSFVGDVDQEASLEDVIALTGGDTSGMYRVTRAGAVVGQLDLKALVRALVRTKASDTRRAF
ncbi:betaine/proline/choline family ABC transporter ATP-binding protein [Cognatishimia sp. SS12]|uniref:quaternary amine ABC transporter ATP-binding protein n=1 Tax=Cognatishimia sp. SS12 TaxID=2979465 RepID=UPI00232B82E2|nr:betaine/proline/choline family ABC transporter ATP-binding protein [Cognatishimia sp. SS12]MDC0739290.1 betaine/proline/choline family ABC transporter ATP-binding protein [Cognatishimia sp. SS12]